MYSISSLFYSLLKTIFVIPALEITHSFKLSLAIEVLLSLICSTFIFLKLKKIRLYEISVTL